jgi:hypothetical protein
MIKNRKLAMVIVACTLGLGVSAQAGVPLAFQTEGWSPDGQQAADGAVQIVIAQGTCQGPDGLECTSGITTTILSLQVRDNLGRLLAFHAVYPASGEIPCIGSQWPCGPGMRPTEETIMDPAWWSNLEGMYFGPVLRNAVNGYFSPLSAWVVRIMKVLPEGVEGGKFTTTPRWDPGVRGEREPSVATMNVVWCTAPAEVGCPLPTD